MSQLSKTKKFYLCWHSHTVDCCYFVQSRSEAINTFVNSCFHYTLFFIAISPSNVCTVITERAPFSWCSKRLMKCHYVSVSHLLFNAPIEVTKVWNWLQAKVSIVTFCPWSPSGPLAPAGPWVPVRPGAPSTPLGPGGPGMPGWPCMKHRDS